MNVLLLLAIVFVLFILADILTARYFKLKRTPVRNISFGVLCVLTVSCAIGGGLLVARNTDMTARTLYNAYSYLLDGNIDKATENAAKIQNPHSEIINLLADCWNDNYASAFINSEDMISSGKLNEDLYSQVDVIYNLSRKMTGLESPMPSNDEAYAQLNKIANNCFALLKISENKEVDFLLGFRRDSMLNNDDFYDVDSRLLSEMLLETPNDRELLRYLVKYCNAVGNLDIAEENAYKLLNSKRSVENTILYTDVIAQKLINDISISVYDPDDKEISNLLKKAEDAEKAAVLYNEGNLRRDENFAKAEEYRKQANGVKAKRIINWLTAQTPLFGDSSGMIDLQLSRLYTAAGNDTKARQILFDLIKRKDRIDSASPIKPLLTKLSDVYYDTLASDDDIAMAISEVLRIDAFLPDSVLSRSYSQFLNDILKYERVSIYISRVDGTDYPTVRAYLNINGKKDGIEELANDFVLEDFTFSDNGFNVPIKNVRRIEDDSNNYISIALVVDTSGSMDGSRLENAKRAVEACIRNMQPETQELSIVDFSNSARILTPLTNDKSVLGQIVSQIHNPGGTNISSGLIAGVESLKNAAGVKSVILMSDGEDGSPELMDDAIAFAQTENVSVFTISLGEADNAYMQNIAQQTGGTFMAAATEFDLINVYTTLQNFIVNNYCFEYKVTDDIGSNPRVLNVGLKDYDVSSSRTYGNGGLVLTKDGSYITRGDSGALQLLYAEPAVVSVKDAELGVPIFISAVGVTDGAKLFINGNEVKNIKIAGDSTIAFTLIGEYKTGALNISVRLSDGTSQSTDKLISVAGTTDNTYAGQTIVLGRSGNTLYADNVEQKDNYTLKLNGNVVLNGFLRTVSSVTVQSNSPITSSGGRITLQSGSISGGGAAYIDFSVSTSGAANYGQSAFGGGSAKVLDSFSFYFDENTININSSRATVSLPGFGDIYGDVQFNGSELIITAYSGSLKELQDNLNYILNGIPLPKNSTSTAMQMITGYSPQGQYRDNDYGLNTNADELNIIIRKDFMSVKGTGTTSGYLGLVEIKDGKLTIDTDNAASMYEITGTARFNAITSALSVDEQTPVTIASAGFYPDTLTLNATGLSINATGLSECFASGKLPKALDGSLNVSYPLSIKDQPYRGQISSLLTDVKINCDKIEFVCTDDWDRNGIKAYNSSDPNKYIVFTNNGVVIPIYDVDEIALFGSELGGEINGTATFSDRQIELSINVDGHLDNNYFGIKHDGKANLTVSIPRNSRPGNIVSVTLSYGGKTMSYNATVAGSISPQDGFNTYTEDYGQ